MSKRSSFSIPLILGALVLVGCSKSESTGGKHTLLNVSYDPTREFYEEFDQAFVSNWTSQHGGEVEIQQSHGGSGKQARAVIDGLDADIVTLALAFDIDVIAQKSGRIASDWQKKLPNDAAPYTSTIVFLVRKGNPKGIKDWDDLVKPDVKVITPNPKTSGGARWNYLAAWAYGKRKTGSEDGASDFLKALYENVPVLDTGARGSTTTFAKNGLGDVLLAWENEAFLAKKEFASAGFEIVVPSLSILAQPPVAVVDANAKSKGNAEIAQAYLEFLYSPTGQRIAAKNFFRPVKPEAADPADIARLPKLELVTVDAEFGGWQAAQKKHFDDGGIFDRIYSPAK